MCVCGCLSTWKSEVNFWCLLYCFPAYYLETMSLTFKFLHLLLCVCTHTCTHECTYMKCHSTWGGMSVTALMWRLEDNSWDSVLIFHHVGPRVADKHLYLLCYLAGPETRPVTEPGTHSLARRADKRTPTICLSPPLPSAGVSDAHCAPQLFIGAKDQHSGPHHYMAGTLPIKPSPQSQKRKTSDHDPYGD